MDKVVIFGEILWDLLPSGKKLGGAPSNFAYHLNVLGIDACVKTSVGDDELGREALAILKDHDISLKEIVVDSNHATGSVLVQLDSLGQASYHFAEDVAWDHLTIDESLLQELPSAQAIYYGTLAARSKVSRHSLRELLQAVPQGTLRVFDLNLRAPFYDRPVIEDLLQGTDLFKLNDEELLVLAAMFSDLVPTTLAPDSSIGDFNAAQPLNLATLDWIENFMESFHIKYFVLTCGSHGSFLRDQQGNSSFCPAKAVEIVDTVGAGDAFTAVCVWGILQKMPLDQINRRASRYAAYLCTQAGAMPQINKEVLDEVTRK